MGNGILEILGSRRLEQRNETGAGFNGSGRCPGGGQRLHNGSWQLQNGDSQ
jgi:hypothetical protein